MGVWRVETLNEDSVLHGAAVLVNTPHSYTYPPAAASASTGAKAGCHSALGEGRRPGSGGVVFVCVALAGLC